ncbi:MAG: DUF4412 domain-containing protein [Deltaproteobacteria bacterium]|nr:DUF4412 domain-containing protein [Deltaproteobacteria bacterium]
MLRIVSLSGLIAVLWTGQAMAVENGTYIEQSIEIEAVTGQPAIQGVQKIWYTATHIRNEMTYGEQTSISIFDLLKKRVILIPSDEKQYIEMSLEDYHRIVAMRLASTDLAAPEAEPVLTNTNQQKKIGEWQCTKYIFEQKGKLPVKSVLWVSKDPSIDFAAYLDLLQKMGIHKMLGKMAEFVGKIEGYPIVVQTELSQKGQKVVSSQRVLKIADGPVDPKLFMIPEGYQPIKDEIIKKLKADQGE